MTFFSENWSNWMAEEILRSVFIIIGTIAKLFSYYKIMKLIYISFDRWKIFIFCILTKDL